MIGQRHALTNLKHTIASMASKNHHPSRPFMAIIARVAVATFVDVLASDARRDFRFANQNRFTEHLRFIEPSAAFLVVRRTRADLLQNMFNEGFSLLRNSGVFLLVPVERTCALLHFPSAIRKLRMQSIQERIRTTRHLWWRRRWRRRLLFWRRRWLPPLLPTTDR